MPMWVVEDSDQILALFLPTGAPLGFAPGRWPITGERHPWDIGDRPVWKGHGVLHLHRPDDPYSVIVFWAEPDRRFSHWYINMQAPYQRTASGIETLDHVLDIIVQPDGSWAYKDEAEMAEAVELGLFSSDAAVQVRHDAAAVGKMLDSGRQWWGHDWAGWIPPASCREARGLPLGWAER